MYHVVLVVSLCWVLHLLFTLRDLLESSYEKEKHQKKKKQTAGQTWPVGYFPGMSSTLFS